MKKILQILIIFHLILLCAVTSSARDRFLKDNILEDRDARWQITAEKMNYFEKDGIYKAEGNVVITRNGQVLSSEKAIYNEKTGIVEVSKDVRLESNGDIIAGERGIFDLNNHNGQIIKGRIFLMENHLYIHGDIMEKTGPNTYLVKGCKVTTCDGVTPAWSITGSEVKVTVEGYGTVKHATFRIRDIPVLYFPYAIFPAKTKRQTGFLPPRAGYSDRNGIDMEVPFFWAVSEQADITLYERYIEKRGFMQGAELRYVAENDSKGMFLFDILSDRLEEKNMDNLEEVELSPFPRNNETRHWLRGKTDQDLPFGLKARLDADFLSDQDYLKEFGGGLFGYKARPDLANEYGRPVDDFYSPTRRSALRIDHDGEEYSLQAITSYYQRPENPINDNTAQPVGGLSFTALPRPVPGSPLFIEFDTDYDYIYREAGQKGHSLSFTPELSYPMWLGHYLEFKPSVGFTRDTQWLEDNTENIKQQSRDIYNMQARVGTILDRSFDLKWRTINRVKHKISPSITYDFRGHKDEDRYRPWFEPVDVEEDINRITLAIENILAARYESKKGDVTYSQLGTFSLSQGYDVEEARRDDEPWRKKEIFEPLVGVLAFSPFPQLDIDTEARWDHYDDDISFADVSLEFTMNRAGGRKDTYSLDYQYTKGENENLNYSLNINFAYGFSAGSSLKRDMKVGHNLGRSYWLDYQAQCWGMRLITENLDGVDSIMVTFQLLGIGGL